MKICPLGAELFLAGKKGRRTDMTKLIVAFRNFANAPNKGVHNRMTALLGRKGICLILRLMPFIRGEALTCYSKVHS